MLELFSGLSEQRDIGEIRKKNFTQKFRNLTDISLSFFSSKIRNIMIKVYTFCGLSEHRDIEEIRKKTNFTQKFRTLTDITLSSFTLAIGSSMIKVRTLIGDNRTERYCRNSQKKFYSKILKLD